MGTTTVAGALTAVVAVAVAAALFAVEDDRDGCEDAARAAFAASRGPAAVLDRAAGRLIADCHGSEPLTRISVGLLEVGRARPAARLARVAADREPDSYLAWAVLARTASPPEATEAAARAEALNPRASAAGP